MMADAAVEFFIEKLKQLLIHRGHLFSDEVEKLDNHLLRFKASIRGAPKLSSGDKQLTEPIRCMRRAVDYAEDTIDAHIIEKNPVNESLTNIVVRSVEEIGAALEEIRCIYTENSTADSDDDDDSDAEDGGTGKIKERLVKEQNTVVGRVDEVERLITEVTEESSELQVLSIYGKAGLGKTALAQRIFHDARIVNEFPIRIWVNISRAFTEKEVFLHILSEFVVLSDDIKRRTDKELADLVASFLRDERFLLVMDDVWSCKDWDKLKLALPFTNKVGRVLITSRSKEVGRAACICLSKWECLVVKEQNAVVGLEDEVEHLSKALMGESAELQVFSIIGLAGMGKTILAQQIFNNARIVNLFPIRIWIYISRAFTAKEVFLHILSEFVVLSDDIKRRTDQELADLVATFLRDERFLLVMDDLWTPQDWDKLKLALPITNRMSSRVLITSRIEAVGWHVNRNRYAFRKSLLDDEECFKLLQLKALRGQEFPSDLLRLGREIVRNCGHGHPLAIVLIGGILVKDFSTDIQTMKAAWSRVYKSLKPILFEGDVIEYMSKIIAMSYEALPYHLRECLVYLGMFPEDFEISVWKLIRLWIAEGFIQQSSNVSLEETAQNYLQELLDRNLVRGVKFKLNGKVKTCRVHDTILDFCIDQAARDGFLQQIKKSDDGGFQPPVHQELKFRRLCIHSDALNFLSRKPNGPSARSFICSSREEMTMPMKDLSTIPKGFKLLRVLDVEPINFNLKLSRDLFQLLHLKYLFLSVKLDVLPSAFSHLLNIQTLVFNTSARTLEVRADILNLAQLRHFKTKASAALLETSTSSQSAGENFLTLASISSESCTNDVFDRARNLKKLGVRGNLASLLDGEKGSFDSLGRLEDLENLKLLYDVYPIPPSGLPVLSLPPPHKFPPKLKILTLSRTCLDWRHMSTIESLENLQVLKLENKAFVGHTWEVNHGGFRRLEALRIERMNLKIWLVSDDQFPRLKHLQLRHCDDLQQVPVELADVQSFVKLDLFHCKRAAASARQIAMFKQPDDEREFSLSISPFW